MRTKNRLHKRATNEHKTISFWKSYILEWIVDICIAGMIVYIVITFAFQNMHVMGNSMIPTLQGGEIVLIDKLIYNIREPKAGDLVAFKHIDGSNEELNFVKRIVGVPGDTVEMIGNTIYVNGQSSIIAENSYEQDGVRRGDMYYPIIIPKDSYFVLGDNRKNSIDSRYQQVGMIPKQEIIGKVKMRLWPLWRFKIF